MLRTWVLRTGVAVLILASPLALAHSTGPAADGFIHGLMHPFSGLDHVLAMAAIGLFAAYLGGRARWLLPTIFVLLVNLGATFAYGHIVVPYVEAAIAASVAVTGALIAARPHFPAATGIYLVGCFGILHGHAHGTEVPAQASLLAYMAGFSIATAVLHVAGIALALVSSHAAAATARRTERLAGIGIALTGVGMLVNAAM
jgi:urease accessory protein